MIAAVIASVIVTMTGIMIMVMIGIATMTATATAIVIVIVIVIVIIIRRFPHDHPRAAVAPRHPLPDRLREGPTRTDLIRMTDKTLEIGTTHVAILGLHEMALPILPRPRHDIRSHRPLYNRPRAISPSVLRSRLALIALPTIVTDPMRAALIVIVDLERISNATLAVEEVGEASVPCAS